MPNLRSHILLAEQIYKRIESAQLREILEKQSALYYLGAVVPDIFLYNILWWELPHLDDILHDYPKPRSVAMIRHMLNELKASSPPDPEKTAFILGLMTHILAENIFHPAIFYFSGNYYDHDHNERHLAVSSHRHLETLLDLYLFEACGVRLDDQKLGKIIYVENKPRKKAFSFFASVLSEASGDGQQIIQSSLDQAYPLILFLNRIFPNKYLYYLLKTFKLLRNEWITPYLRLFYPPSDNNLPTLFTSDFHYHDPVTGEEHAGSMRQLLERTATEGAEVIEKAYAYLMGERDNSFLAEIKITAGPMHYFSKMRF